MDDPKEYKNEIWTKVQHVSIDAPEQVEVSKIRGDIQQTLMDLLDAEQYDDDGPEPLFDPDAFEEPPAGDQREQYKLGDEEMQAYEKMVVDFRLDALKKIEVLEKEEEFDAAGEELDETVVAAPLREAFAQYQQRWRDEDPEPQAINGKKGLVDLDPEDIAAIIDSEKNDLLSHEAIAAKHGISTGLAGRVIRAAKKNKNYVKERYKK